MNSRIRNILIALILILFTTYFFYEVSGLIYGFSVQIFYPNDGDVLSTTHITVSGQVNNASFIFLNGRNIFTDEEGIFQEDLILAPGINIIELSAEDKFGRIVKEKRQVVVK